MLVSAYGGTANVTRLEEDGRINVNCKRQLSTSAINASDSGRAKDEALARLGLRLAAGRWAAQRRWRVFPGSLGLGAGQLNKHPGSDRVWRGECEVTRTHRRGRQHRKTRVSAVLHDSRGLAIFFNRLRHFLQPHAGANRDVYGLILAGGHQHLNGIAQRKPAAGAQGQYKESFAGEPCHCAQSV